MGNNEQGTWTQNKAGCSSQYYQYCSLILAKLPHCAEPMEVTVTTSMGGYMKYSKSKIPSTLSTVYLLNEY